MNTKRTINGTQYNVPWIVDEAVAAVDSMTLNVETARQSLARLGHQNPADELVTRYARETAILNILGRKTGANFAGQIGKINFADRDATIQDVQSYLNRRIHGQHARWTANH
jgi:hypothetical protein